MRRTPVFRRTGRVRQVVGLAIESAGPMVQIGELCRIERTGGDPPLRAEAVGFRDRRVLLLPLGDMSGIEPGNVVVASGGPLRIGVGWGLLGRVVDAFGRAMDGGPPPEVRERRPVTAEAPSPLQRERVSEVMELGIRGIDGPLTCGKGQRVGIFSGSGVGKSSLLGMVARHTAADVNVIALVGERGREVREFLERDLGEGLSRSVVVVATSEQPALVRLKAAFTATAIAEYFRDQGRDVILMMDSITRAATAQREAGLAAGEPPTTRGYTPSVFAMLPKLLERAGTAARGSITGIYAVLVEQDDLSEPVADAVKAILDGHIVLSRRIAEEGRYPAVDVLASVSRVMNDIVSPEHRAAAALLRDVLSTYAEHEDMINIGAYERGTNPRIDRALALVGRVRQYLAQSSDEPAPFAESVRRLLELVPN
ncbi:MAG: FliI/YscN family ATPase [Armatimonadota bacterium]